MSESNEQIEIEGIISRYHVQRVNKAKFIAMPDVLLPILPPEALGMPVAKAKVALLSNLSQELFPGRRKGEMVAEGRAARSPSERRDQAWRQEACVAVQDWEINGTAMLFTRRTNGWTRKSDLRCTAHEQVTCGLSVHSRYN